MYKLERTISFVFLKRGAKIRVKYALKLFIKIRFVTHQSHTAAAATTLARKTNLALIKDV